MSVCTFIASDFPMEEFAPPQEYPLEINVDEGKIYDGGADDNYYLLPFYSLGFYTDKKYGLSLEWNFTEGRARQLIEYIKNLLEETESVELWHVWLMDYYEFEDRPYIHRKKVSIADLTAELIRGIDDAPIWNTPDKSYPERPTFYCLSIVR